MSIGTTDIAIAIKQLNTAGLSDALEIIDTTPRGLRFARKPDGRSTLQVANCYTKGTEGGVIWLDVPTVEVDWEGNVIEGTCGG